MGAAEAELKTSECAEKIRLIRHYRVATADYNRAVQYYRRDLARCERLST